MLVGFIKSWRGAWGMLLMIASLNFVRYLSSIIVILTVFSNGKKEYDLCLKL